jgi:threonine aldolase
MFGSDNQAPAHPTILDAIVQANAGRSGSYGDDAWSARALASVKDVFQTHDLDMYMVGTGSAANGLALSLLCPPWGAVLSVGDAHVIADEGSGPEHFTSGARMIGIGAADGRLQADHLITAAERFSRANVQSPQPRAVTISNLSENGLAYTPDQIAQLGAICQREAWGLHMDGARFANAVAFTGATPADMTWRAGVDALSFGLTKNGGVCAEALIVFGSARDAAGPFLRKRAGHLFSKQRYMSAQLVAMLEDGLWLNLARDANGMAASLGRVLANYGCALAYPIEGNEVFAALNEAQVQALTHAQVGFYPWAPAGAGIYRFVTCWQTSTLDVDVVATALSQL